MGSNRLFFTGCLPHYFNICLIGFYELKTKWFFLVVFHKSITVIIVDDNPFWRKILRSEMIGFLNWRMFQFPLPGGTSAFLMHGREFGQ